MWHSVAVGAIAEAAIEALQGRVHQRQVQQLHLPEGGQGPERHLAEVGAVVIWHSVAVGAIVEASYEALQSWVRQCQVQHLHLLEGGQCPARHLAERDTVVPWQSVAVGAIAEAFSPAPESKRKRTTSRWPLVRRKYIVECGRRSLPDFSLSLSLR